MAATRTPGITTSGDGRFFIDKRYRGIRIGMRIGAIDQAQAEARVRAEMVRIDSTLDCRMGARPRFSDCATRYLM
ncbi:MAG: hypothetical protein KIT60_05350 [Burkholderiaceae bacterium]|nr:hypothetical protein [Burkholderiaceae bacterium]